MTSTYNIIKEVHKQSNKAVRVSGSFRKNWEDQIYDKGKQDKQNSDETHSNVYI